MKKSLITILTLLFLSGEAYASGALGIIAPNSTTTISDTSTILRYIGLPNFTGTISYLKVNCGGTAYDLLDSNFWFEANCSSLKIQNTNLASSYVYSVIYGDTDEIYYLKQIASASSSVSFPDYILTQPVASENLEIATDTSILIHKNWDYGQIFIVFLLIVMFMYQLFKDLFLAIFPKIIRIKSERK